MDVAHLADRPAAEQFHEPEVAGVLVVLRPHLGRQPLLGRELRDEPCFLDGVGEGLLAIDMEAAPQGADGGRSMVMVGGGDDDGVELRVGEHRPVVGKPGRRWESARRGPEGARVDIAESDDVFPRYGIEVRAAAAADADHPDVEPVVGSQNTPAASRDREQRRPGSGCRAEHRPP